MLKKSELSKLLETANQRVDFQKDFEQKHLENCAEINKKIEKVTLALMYAHKASSTKKAKYHVVPYSMSDFRTEKSIFALQAMRDGKVLYLVGSYEPDVYKFQVVDTNNPKFEDFSKEGLDLDDLYTLIGRYVGEKEATNIHFFKSRAPKFLENFEKGLKMKLQSLRKAVLEKSAPTPKHKTDYTGFIG
tara:strand:- start:2481 stop:3047 length:567 start_codon:yes stop_codon:yes gene_type:complete